MSSRLRRALGTLVFSRRTFELFQRVGIHVTRRHFYSPIPDTRILKVRTDLWDREMDLLGVDMREDQQLELLDDLLPKYQNEFDFPENKTSIPYEYYVNNGSFGLISAAVLHGMIRHYKPVTLIEVGSGFSTFVSARAGLMNQAEGHPVSLIAVEPHPDEVLKASFPGLSELIQKPVEELDLAFFDQLGDHDILFIDSSHVLRIGGDVAFLYLDVLPRLKKGVVVHIHDVMFPRHYSKDLVIGQQFFWNEQYLLQAFLTYNERFEVLFCANYLHNKYPERVRAVIPPPKSRGKEENYLSTSFWMRRVG